MPSKSTSLGYRISRALLVAFCAGLAGLTCLDIQKVKIESVRIIKPNVTFEQRSNRYWVKNGSLIYGSEFDDVEWRMFDSGGKEMDDLSRNAVLREFESSMYGPTRAILDNKNLDSASAKAMLKTLHSEQEEQKPTTTSWDFPVHGPKLGGWPSWSRLQKTGSLPVILPLLGLAGWVILLERRRASARRQQELRKS